MRPAVLQTGWKVSVSLCVLVRADGDSALGGRQRAGSAWLSGLVRLFSD